MQGHDRTGNFNSELWPIIWPRWDIFYLAQREHAVDDFAKDDVLPVEEIAWCGRDEKLRPKIRQRTTRESVTNLTTIRVGSRVGLIQGEQPTCISQYATVLAIDRRPGTVCFTWKFSS